MISARHHKNRFQPANNLSKVRDACYLNKHTPTFPPLVWKQLNDIFRNFNIALPQDSIWMKYWAVVVVLEAFLWLYVSLYVSWALFLYYEYKWDQCLFDFVNLTYRRVLPWAVLHSKFNTISSLPCTWLFVIISKHQRYWIIFHLCLNVANRHRSSTRSILVGSTHTHLNS